MATTVLAGAQVSPSGIQGPASFRLPQNYLSGYSYGLSGVDAVNDLAIGPGVCRDSTDQYDIVLPVGLIKQTDALWAAGNNQGGRDTGATANGTWHTFAIYNPTTGVSDVLFSLSLTAPTLPSGFTAFRRIWSCVRSAGAVVQYRQLGDYFQILFPQMDLNDAQPATSQVFSCGFGLVPTGMKLLVHASYRAQNNATVPSSFNIREPDVSFVGLPEIWCQVLSIPVATVLDVWTGPSATVTITNSNVGTHFWASGLGFWDFRGKNGPTT